MQLIGMHSNARVLKLDTCRPTRLIYVNVAP